MRQVIDFHVHLFPDNLAERAMAELSQRAGYPSFLDGTERQLLRSMQWAGIQKAVIQPVATRPQQVSGINKWAHALRSEKVEPFAAAFPCSPDWQRDLEEIVRLGFLGVKLHPDYQGFFVDDKALFPFYEQAFKHKLYILFHAGVDIGLPPPVHCTPQRLRTVVEEFGGQRIIAAHLGGWDMWDQVAEYLVGLPLFLDTSLSVSYLGRTRVRDLIRAHGPHRVLFGTDSPWAPQLSSLGQVRALGLDAQELEAILCGNAEKILAR